MKKLPIINSLAAMQLFLFCLITPVYGQDNTENKANQFYFTYIAPDRAVDVAALRDRINETVEKVRKNNCPAIFYLATGTNPIIVKLNTGNDETTTDDDYANKIDYMLKTNTSWQLDTPNDIKCIHELLRENSYVNDEGHLRYSLTELDFHVGSNFWEQKCNESFIGRLYFELNAAQYYQNPAFRFNVYFYYPPALRGNYDMENKFGMLNPDGINEKVTLITPQNR